MRGVAGVKVQWFLMGDVGLSVDSTARRVNGGRQLDLLALLLCHANRALSVPAIIDELWPHDPPKTAKNTVQRHVSDLRQTLGPARDRLSTAPNGYVLRVGPTELDLDVLEADIAAAKRSVAQRAFSDAHHALTLAHARLQDSLAPGCETPTIVIERQRITNLRIGLLELCGQLFLDHGLGTLDHLQQWSSQFPLNERLAAQAMFGLAAAGRQAEALALCSDVRTRLRDELGVDPSRELAKAELAILQQRSDPGTPSPTAGHSSAQTDARTNVSELGDPTPPDLIGRSDLVELAEQTLASNRLVTLTGPGGSGKTTLAMEVARTVGHRYQAVYRVLLAEVERPEVVPEAVASALGLGIAQQSDGLTELPHHIATRIAAHSCLLILDNAEHVIGAVADLVNNVLANAPGARIVVTSREHLALPTEIPIVVDPLPVGDGDGPDPTSPAVQLFARRGARVSGIDEAALRSDPASAQICRAVDGLPLAIELAAAQLRTITASELATRIHEPLRVLGRQRTNDRQSSLQNLLDWSWQLLDETERRFLAEASLYRTFTLDTAEHLDSANGLQTLSRLVAKSLIQIRRSANDGSDYYLLETVRDYCKRRRQEVIDMHEAQRRHAVWVHGQLRQFSLARCFVDADVMSVAARMVPDTLSALDWVHDNACSRDHFDLVGRISGMLSHRGPFHEGRRVVARAAAAIEDLCPEHAEVHDDDRDRELHGAVLLAASTAAQAAGDGEATFVHGLAAVELVSDDCYDWAPLALSTMGVFIELAFLDGSAEHLLLKAESIADQTASSQLNQSVVSIWRGNWELMNRRYEPAIKSFEDALVNNPPRGPVLLLAESGILAAQVLRGEHTAAKKFAESTLSSPTTDAWHYVIDIYRAIAIGTDDTAKAAQLLTHVLGGSVDHDLPGRREDVQIGAAVLAWHAGDRARCVELLSESSMRSPAHMALLVEYADGEPGRAMSEEQWRSVWQDQSRRCIVMARNQNTDWLTTFPRATQVRDSLRQLLLPT